MLLRIPRDGDQRSDLKPISFTVVVRNGDRHRIGTAAQGVATELNDSTERLGPGIRRNIDGLPEVGLGDQGRRLSGTALVV